ncbi:MAG: hypothetical protein WC584_00830 [Candidatus Pacearchaeota archaeon]
MGKNKIKDKFEEIGCEFKNETACDEDLEEEDVDIDDAESSNYEDEE